MLFNNCPLSLDRKIDFIVRAIMEKLCGYYPRYCAAENYIVVKHSSKTKPLAALVKYHSGSRREFRRSPRVKLYSARNEGIRAVSEKEISKTIRGERKS